MNKWDAWLVQGLAVLVLGIAVLQTVGADRLSGVLFYLTFPLTLWSPRPKGSALVSRCNCQESI